MHPVGASVTKSQGMTASRRTTLTGALRRTIVTVSIVALLATACGGSDGDDASPSAAGGGGGGGKTVTISNFEFSPDVLEVRVGDTVTVVNKDSADHTVTATDNSFDTGRFASGTRMFTVTKAGRFEYVCTVHPFMPHKFIQVSG